MVCSIKDSGLCPLVRTLPDLKIDVRHVIRIEKRAEMTSSHNQSKGVANTLQPAKKYTFFIPPRAPVSRVKIAHLS
jgi:hypothetical protein